jgi:N-acetylmuramoyl-L-alanine amidase-like protein
VKRILVQAGHQSPREPGFEAQTGAPGEAELVMDIQHALVRLLNQDADFHAIPMPGQIPNGTKADGAIFLHADGAANPSARGYSLGFPPGFEVNRRLAHLIADEFEKISGHPPRRPDNNTVDMSQYYGYGLVDTPGPEVLVEHGFVTNPEEHRWLKTHVSQLAEAEHTALRRFFGLHDGPHPGGSVTPNTKLLAAARAPAGQAEQYLLARPCGQYSENDARRIVDLYYTTAAAVGLDPLLAVAQMAEETGHLTSFWSQRPRRNLAGIGVTGKPGEGLSFPDLPTAVLAHTGRLLAYVLPSGTENPAQAQLIGKALAFRPLTDDHRGVAPTLAGLAGAHGWAADPEYAVKVAGVANEILAQ